MTRLSFLSGFLRKSGELHPLVIPERYETLAPCPSLASIAEDDETPDTVIEEDEENIALTVEVPGETLLHVAARKGMVRKLESLVRTNILDLNERDDTGMTALMVAARHGHYECVRLLRDHPGVNLFICDNLNQTAVDHAKFCGDLELMCMIQVAMKRKLSGHPPDQKKKKPKGSAKWM